MKLIKSVISLAVGFLTPFGANAILNGREVGKDDLIRQSVVAIQVAFSDSQNMRSSLRGTGVLIGRKVVLTSAKQLAMAANKSNIQVEVFFELMPDWEKSTSNKIKSSKWIIHPEFAVSAFGKGVKTDNDLAIIFLDNESPSQYRPMEIAEPTNLAPMIDQGAQIAGFGPNGDKEPFLLRDGYVPFHEFSKNNFWDSPKLWFKQEKHAICEGDFGGPVIFEDQGADVVYGIAAHVDIDSQGRQHCMTRGAFTNIVFYREWILKSIRALL